MSFHVADSVLKEDQISDTILSQVSDPNMLRQHPHMRLITDDFMEHIQDLRKFYDENRRIRAGVGTTRGGSKGGTMIHVARIPVCLWAQHTRSDPHILHDKPKIYRLLKTDFKEYRVGGFSLVG